MSQIGRNDPCPCGSGKKYKKCCLAKEEAAAAEVRGEQSAITTALDWLDQHYPDAAGAAVSRGFLGDPGDKRRVALETLPPQVGQAIRMNVGEWLLLDAELSIDGQSRRALELVLGPDGPNLTDSGRERLLEFAEQPLRLYEVRQVKKKEGLLLLDLIHPETGPVWVQEKNATGFVWTWDIFAARLDRKGDNRVLTGAVYAMERDQALACLAEIRRELVGNADDLSQERKIVTGVIIDHWLNSLLNERPLPKVDSPRSARALRSVQALLRERYEKWPAVPLPELGGQSPLQAVETGEGRKAVVELLKGIEQLEERRAANCEERPFDIGFLWQRLGLDREQV